MGCGDGRITAVNVLRPSLLATPPATLYTVASNGHGGASVNEAAPSNIAASRAPGGTLHHRAVYLAMEPSNKKRVPRGAVTRHSDTLRHSTMRHSTISPHLVSAVEARGSPFS